MLGPPTMRQWRLQKVRPRVVLSRKSLILKITSTALSAPSVAYRVMPMLAHVLLLQRSQDVGRSACTTKTGGVAVGRATAHTVILLYTGATHLGVATACTNHLLSRLRLLPLATPVLPLVSRFISCYSLQRHKQTNTTINTRRDTHAQRERETGM